VKNAGYLAVGLFVLAVVSLHFIGMAALSVTPAGTAGDAASSSALAAFAVVGVGMLVVGSGVISYLIDEQASQETFLRLQQLALSDALTGLPNRTRALEHLESEFALAAGSGEKVAVIGIDLDRFKEINDVHGHKAGDDVLRTVGRRLALLLEEGEFAARIGGDEFMAVKRFRDRKRLDTFLTRLDDALTAPLNVGGALRAGAASIGVAVYPDDGADREDLICHADLAMYQSKGDITRHVSFYQPEMEQAAIERYALAQDLGRAEELGQFALHYQVQKCVATGQTIGYEALLRWYHPVQGYIPPDVFIPIAEETGQILAIGEWVLRTACEEAVLWDIPHKVAVNLSPVQVVNADIPGLLRSVLLETGLAPQRLDLEITETTFIADKAKALHVLRQIKALGVTLSIDDFGIGYSSLSALADITADEIKIDRSFITDIHKRPRSQGILRAIESLSEALGITVVAEGLESYEELAYLQAATKIRYAQGYYFSRPIFLEELKLASPSSSEARVSVASRPMQPNRQGYSRASGYRR
jgi:diguanylate cyclase (GGDEF)-like protein